MNDSKHTRNFWLGNGVLAIALLVLLNLDALSQVMGFGAMILWIILAAVGAWLLMHGKSGPDSPE